MKKTKITIAGTTIEVPFGTEVIVEIGSQVYNFDNQGRTLGVKNWRADESNDFSVIQAEDVEVIQYERK